MSANNVPATIFRGAIVDKDGSATPQFMRFLHDTMQKTYNSLTIQGQIAQTTPVEGRVDPLYETVKNIDATGIVLGPGVDLSRPYSNKDFSYINGQVALDVQVKNQLASLHQANNAPTNRTNYCTVDSIDNGTDATIRVYDAVTGTPGTPWDSQVSATIQGPYPALSQAGFAYTTTYYVMYDPVGNDFVVSVNFSDSLADNLIFCGKVTTVASGGGGGTPGGGGSGGGSGGCVEVGTPVIEPAGTEHEIQDCDEWVSLQFPGHSPVNMHPDTLVYVLKRASELCEGERISVGKEGKWRVDGKTRRFYKKSQKVKRTCPGGRYLAGTAQIELHNMKIGP